MEAGHIQMDILTKNIMTHNAYMRKKTKESLSTLKKAIKTMKN